MQDPGTYAKNTENILLWFCAIFFLNKPKKEKKQTKQKVDENKIKFNDLC